MGMSAGFAMSRRYVLLSCQPKQKASTIPGVCSQPCLLFATSLLLSLCTSCLSRDRAPETIWQIKSGHWPNLDFNCNMSIRDRTSEFINEYDIRKLKRSRHKRWGTPKFHLGACKRGPYQTEDWCFDIFAKTAASLCSEVLVP